MKVRKTWFFSLILILACSFALYAAFKNPDSGLGEKSEIADKSPETHLNLWRQVNAICELQKNNWILANLDKESELDKERQDLSFFHNEIIGEVEKMIHSREFAALGKKDEDEENEIIEGKVNKGDTISSILEKSAQGKVQQYISATKKVFSLSSFKEGQPYFVHIDPETGRLKRFEYEINDQSRLVVEGTDKVEARLEDIQYVTLLDTCEGVIEDNLFQAVADIGEKPQMALKLVKLFGSEINFARNLEKGDSFSVLIEKLYRDGEYKGYGRIIAATFTNHGKSYEAFLFRDGQGRETYYNENGENLNKTLLQSPLAVTRITSRFTQSRFHPILRKAKPHLGVDYGAPTGTQVKAVGDGIVTERGWAGGYGNQVVIKHGAGLESMYSHLSGFARGIREGARVKQGQVIGFVGSTGLSTGPHLDFRLRQNGKFINPSKAINPRGMPVAQRNMEAFKTARELARDCLEGRKKIENYTVDSIVPLAVKSSPEEEFLEEEKPKARSRVSKSRKRRYLRRAFPFKRPSDIMNRRRPLL